MDTTETAPSPHFIPSRSPLQCATPEAVSDEDAGCAEKRCELCGEYESECTCDDGEGQ